MTNTKHIAALAALLFLLAAGAFQAPAQVQQVVWTGEGVPAPIPLATGDIEVAAFLFPGWGEPTPGQIGAGGEWPSLFPDPTVRPLLGFYNDHLPEVNDWHIYWARTFGVSLFIHNWYWNDGNQILHEQLEQGFLNANLREHMDFAIQWSNHPLPQVWGAETPLRFDRDAMLDVVDYWIANYFQQPNYRKIDGRPLVILFDPRPVIAQNGGNSGWLQTLALMNQRMAAAGLGDLYLIATDNDAQLMKNAGFEGITGYSTHGIPPPCPVWSWGPGFRMPYAYMVWSTHTYWRSTFMRQASISDYILPIGTGWDDSYRHPLGNGVKMTAGFSPAAFRSMISTAPDALRPDGLRMVVFDAWNEWTEGAYLEPTKRFGFGMLEAVAATFGETPAPSQAYIPSVQDAIALSRYAEATWLQWWNLPLNTPLPPHINLPMVPSGHRCLAAGEQPQGGIVWSWTHGENPAPQVVNAQVSPSPDGLLYTPTNNDPQMIWSIPAIPVDEITAITVLVRDSGTIDDFGEVFYAAPGSEFTQANSARFTLGESDDFERVGLAFDGFRWTGEIGELRIDIGAQGRPTTVREVRVHGTGTPVGWKVR